MRGPYLRAICRLRWEINNADAPTPICATASTRSGRVGQVPARSCDARIRSPAVVGGGQTSRVRGALVMACASARASSTSRSSRPRPIGCGSRTSPTCGAAKGWLFLATVQDVYSRRIVGGAALVGVMNWLERRRPAPGLVADALRMALGAHVIGRRQYLSLAFGQGRAPPASPNRLRHRGRLTTTTAHVHRSGDAQVYRPS
jgi:hypothetical protein